MRMTVVLGWLKRNFKRLFLSGLMALAASIAAIIYAKSEIESTAEGKISTEPTVAPLHRVGLVLGCAKELSNGRQNLYFANRMQAAYELYRAGAVEYLLVSGDNSRADYDESSDMKAALVELGVPEERIVCDYAGFSTLDSIVRAKEVFQLDSFIIVSQDFHVRRAVYIAEQHGINAHGYVASGVNGVNSIRTDAREYLARVKTVLDVSILDRQPRFLGDAIPIGS